jgi:hypothetical protein
MGLLTFLMLRRSARPNLEARAAPLGLSFGTAGGRLTTPRGGWRTRQTTDSLRRTPRHSAA